ncbi:hypothetical protein [Nocardiopsis sp. FIRDI 009]|uniref:hypothetical protein n=1 Tax=Nocardiopsis sp. FIRDI 009 TaxID=714197 RepID=UPI000E244670|nr:hypothetical protein [Nocardiopsis sp. FIRDI 009]
MHKDNRALGADGCVTKPFGTRTSRSSGSGRPRHLTADPGPGGRPLPVAAERGALGAEEDRCGGRE